MILSKSRTINSYSELLPKKHYKEIITYCYSIPCMTGRKVEQLLAENGIFVKTLIIGWNKWRHFWTLWNHEHECETVRPEDYIQNCSDKGAPLVIARDIFQPEKRRLLWNFRRKKTGLC